MAITRDDLPDLTREKFLAAQATEHLLFRPTEVTILYPHDIPFQLRFCPSLAHKSKAPSASAVASAKRADPFHEPPDALFIADVGSPPAHFLVLNKFAIVPHHFILATKEFKEQTHLLEQDDWAAAWACLQAWATRGKQLYGFFNSGQHSGASQPHRHIQFLPVESMMGGVDEGDWHLLVDRLAADPHLDLPFTYFAAALPLNPTAVQLHALYLSLHRQACDAMAAYLPEPTNHEAKISIDAGQSSISYNLGFTTKVMALIPRRAEGAMIPTGLDEPKAVGPIALNGTVLAGTLLVKNELEWQSLKEDGSKLWTVLEAIGISSAEVKAERLPLYSG